MSTNRNWVIAAGVAGAAALAAGTAWWAKSRTTVPIGGTGGFDDDSDDSDNSDAGDGVPPTQPPQQADFRILILSITDPVIAGKHAQATIGVANVGDAVGTLTIDGKTLQAGVVQGTWIGQAVTVAPGETAEVALASAGPMHEQFAGQRLTAVFTGGGLEVRGEFTVVSAIVVSAIPTVGQITFINPSPPGPNDTLLLQVHFLRGGVQIASWARAWVHQAKYGSPFAQVYGDRITLTRLGRQQDVLDGQIQSLPLQANQVRVTVTHLPDPAIRWTLNGLTAVISDGSGATLHQMVFNGVGPGQTATATVKLG